MSNLCPICNRIGKKIRDVVRDKERIQVYRCRECLLDYSEAWEDEGKITEYYKVIQPAWHPNVEVGSLKYNEHEIRFREVFPWLRNDTRLLEIGCGGGLFLSKVKPFVGVAEGCEIAPSHIHQLRSAGFKVWDCSLDKICPEQPYDIVCMYALLEHIPNVISFMADLKKLIHRKTQVFIEVPNLFNPLVYCYDIPEFREFYYRSFRLYYFTERSLGKLLRQSGFECEMKPLMQCSITNHLHWLYWGKKQSTTNDMVNVTLPRKLLTEKTPDGLILMDILDMVDDLYRYLLTESGVGDLLSCRAWLE